MDLLTNVLEKSIKYEKALKDADQLAAENAYFYNQTIAALDIFEKRFLSDPNQFAPGEFEWYADNAIYMKNVYGRPNIIDKVTEVIFNSTMGIS